jgi:hypothetical protein
MRGNVGTCVAPIGPEPSTAILTIGVPPAFGSAIKVAFSAYMLAAIRR